MKKSNLGLNNGRPGPNERGELSENLSDSIVSGRLAAAGQGGTAGTPRRAQESPAPNLTPAQRGVRMKLLAGGLSTDRAAKTMKRNSTILMVLTLAFVGVPCAAAGQQPQKLDAQQSSQAGSAKKPALAGAARVSTGDALANVARQKAANKDADSQAPSGDAVLEFHEAPPSAASSHGSALSNNSKRFPLKDIHGEAYGLAGSGANQEGGKVGGQAKDGKTSIYVETHHTGISPSH